MTAIISDAVYQKLVDAGIVPQGARRVVIDLNVREPVKIYVEMIGARALIDFDWAGTLHESTITVTNAAPSADVPRGTLVATVCGICSEKIVVPKGEPNRCARHKIPPPVETVTSAFAETPLDPAFDWEALQKLRKTDGGYGE